MGPGLSLDREFRYFWIPLKPMNHYILASALLALTAFGQHSSAQSTNLDKLSKIQQYLAGTDSMFGVDLPATLRLYETAYRLSTDLVHNKVPPGRWRGEWALLAESANGRRYLLQHLGRHFLALSARSGVQSWDDPANGAGSMVLNRAKLCDTRLHQLMMAFSKSTSVTWVLANIVSCTAALAPPANPAFMTLEFNRGSFFGMGSRLNY